MRAFPLFALALLLAGCFDKTGETRRLSGETMGTAYHVVAVDVPARVGEADLAAAVEGALAAVSASMSNWDAGSEVSRFNAGADTEPVEISAAFAHVMEGANRIHALSGGRFDVTLSPLIDLWGFGARSPDAAIPPDAAIGAARAHVGQGRLLKLENGHLAKTDPELSVNLSAIAKGYGNDAVAEALRGLGIDNYLVEIGGDLVAAGRNEQGEDWRIGIETPGATRSVEMVLPVTDLGMATSGDYRNFFEEGGARYSHVIDPTTGRPVTHRVTSVTVLAEDGMMADGWATAMMVLGDEAGMRIAREQDLAVLFISRSGDGAEAGFIQRASPAFERLRKTR